MRDPCCGRVFICVLKQVPTLPPIGIGGVHYRLGVWSRTNVNISLLDDSSQESGFEEEGGGVVREVMV